MSQIPLAFFQAGATAIPTILIALAIGMKHGTQEAESIARQSRRERRTSIGFVLLLVLTVVGGEFSALFALLSGSGNYALATMVWLGVSMGLLTLIGELLKPILGVLSKNERRILIWPLLVLWCGVFVLFLFEAVVFTEV
ncbi:UNVERIFIED_ORG: heme exporter protein D [Arthrobacter sp. UYEF1]